MGRPPRRVIPVERSYAHCRRVTRDRAKNFYYAFRLLDGPRRDAICAIYAFMRRCDDLSDEPGATVRALDQWRAELERGLRGMLVEDPLWPAFFDTVARHRIPTAYFHEMIDGVSSDLTRPAVQDWPELRRYCYQVASTPGLCLVHILGFDDPRALELAEQCGIAFQLTNIIRDVAEDARLGRTYLPAEDMDRFQVTHAHLTAPAVSPELRRLLRFEAERAFECYETSSPIVQTVSPETRPALASLIAIYRRLLTRIEQRDFEVLAGRIRLSTPEKVRILIESRLRGWK
ncbi:MAG: phytoene/squalene synthase family protein [Bryobacteraceae bacterium]